MPSDEIGRVTLNLSGEEAKQLLGDYSGIINTAAETELTETRRSIYDKLQEQVGRKARQSQDAE